MSLSKQRLHLLKPLLQLQKLRGYDSGDVGSGRSYVLASVEYRFLVLPIVGSVLFADFASDLGSGDTVLGDPADRFSCRGTIAYFSRIFFTFFS